MINIIRTILMVVLLIVVVLLIALFLLLIIPFQYRLELCDENDERYILSLRYLIFHIAGELNFKPKVSLKMKLWEKILVNTSAKKTKKQKNSIEDTGFIKNKGLEKEVTDSKKEIKKLFLSAKKSESILKENRNAIVSQKDKDKKIIKANNIVDGFKKIFPSDLIYVIKKIFKEAINVHDKIKPNKCKINIEYGNNDAYKKGLLLSVAAPLYALMGDDLNVSIAKHNQTSLKLIYFGNPVLITLLSPIIRLLLDKKVRAFIFKKP